MNEQTAAAVAVSTVKRFLKALEDRDLERAGRLLGPGFRMEFPGGNRFGSLADLVAWAAGRYRFAHKTYDRFDALPGEAGMVVYCYGMLSGEWPNGDAFSNVRFIDRFVLRDGQLVDQKVWNDLADFRP